MRFFTEIYKKYPDDSEIIKRAKAIAHTLKNMTIFIREDELLIGNETSKNLGEKICLDLYRYDNSLEKKSFFKQLVRRKLQPFFITEEEIEELMELIPFWKGKSFVGDRVTKSLLKKGLLKGKGKVESMTPNIAIQLGTTEGHICAGYEKLLNLGYKGILEKATHYQEDLLESDPYYKEKYDFYEAVKIYYEAAMEFAARFADLALQMATKETNIQRKVELNNLNKMMTKLELKPPDTFYEAIQFIWFSQNIANIIYERSVLALGRLDQILRPYYEIDIKNNRISREFALELIEELNLKLTWNVSLLPTDFTMVANALGQNIQTITIAGVNQNGEDATNELSYLFLEAYKNLKVFTTDLSIRVNTHTPKEFFKEAIKVFKHTSGLAFYNDDIIIPALEKTGYSLDDARNYNIVGCVEPSGQGNTFAATGRMFLNLPGILELTLNNGYSNSTRGVDGLRSGEPGNFSSFNEFMDAFTNQLKFNIEKCVEIAAVGDGQAMRYYNHPFISATIQDCLKNGKDYVCGGAKYNFSSITAYGFATLVDSLYNIKKVVYEEKRMSLPEFVEIINSNFKEHELFRQKLKNNYQKWGNDQGEIDEFAFHLWDSFTSEVSQHKTLRGGSYNAGAYSMGVHVMIGFLTRSTADGRKANEPISNSLSPVNNVEKNGLTASLNSIAMLNYTNSMNGIAVNIRIHPQNLQSDENIEKLTDLIKSYFKQGGMQIQPNVVSSETLIDAQRHPEEYLDLIVKVGGYNATFVDLGTPIQNDIIDRLEHTL